MDKMAQEIDKMAQEEDKMARKVDKLAELERVFSGWHRYCKIEGVNAKYAIQATYATLQTLFN